MTEMSGEVPHVLITHRFDAAALMVIITLTFGVSEFVIMFLLVRTSEKRVSKSEIARIENVSDCLSK